MSKSNQFSRLSRGTVFTTGEAVRQYDEQADQAGIRDPYFEHTTFVKLSATVAVAYEDGKTLPDVQYIPAFWQQCKIVGHIADGLGNKQ